LEEFKALIENNSRIYMLVQSMFEQVPQKPPYDRDPTKDFPRIRDYHVRLSSGVHMGPSIAFVEAEGE
jgi:phosphatidylserine decarboxylase